MKKVEFSQEGLYAILFTSLELLTDDIADALFWNRKLFEYYSNSAMSLFIVAAVARHIDDIDTEAQALKKLRISDVKLFEALQIYFTNNTYMDIIHKILKDEHKSNSKEFYCDIAELNNKAIAFKPF